MATKMEVNGNGKGKKANGFVSGRIGVFTRTGLLLGGSGVCKSDGGYFVISKDMRRACQKILDIVGRDTGMYSSEMEIAITILKAKPEATSQLVEAIARAMNDGFELKANDRGRNFFVKGALPIILGMNGELTEKEIAQICLDTAGKLGRATIPQNKTQALKLAGDAANNVISAMLRRKNSERVQMQHA
ncbi:MAG: hypothetical protein V1822_01540 [Candidatus Micrarchaeota archaeon]